MSKKFYNLKDSYKVYSRDTNKPVEINTYLSIVKGFMKFLIRKLLFKGELLLPERFGTLQVIGKKIKVRIEDGKIKGLAPDWENTKKLWGENVKAKKEKKLVYHFNEDTGGVRYRFFWSKVRVLVQNKTLYSLKLTRTNKRALSKLIKQGKEYLIKN